MLSRCRRRSIGPVLVCTATAPALPGSVCTWEGRRRAWGHGVARGLADVGTAPRCLGWAPAPGVRREATAVWWDGRTSIGAHAGGNGIKVLKLGRRGVPVIPISTLPESNRLKIVRLTLNSHDQKKKRRNLSRYVKAMLAYWFSRKQYKEENNVNEAQGQCLFLKKVQMK